MLLSGCVFLSVMDASRKQNITLFSTLGSDYIARGAVWAMELDNAHDVHAFYALRQTPGSSPKVLHLQGYPGMSRGADVVILGRVMEQDLMVKERASGVSVGNEHDAVMGYVSGLIQTPVAYDIGTLANLIARDVPELR